MGGTTTLLVVAILATFCSAHPSSVQYSSTKAEAKVASEAEARSEAANSFSTSLLGRDGVTRHLSVDRKAKAAAESKAQAKANSEKNEALITLPNGQVVSKFDSAQGWETKTSAATSTSNEINIKYSQGNAGRTGCSSSVANCGGVKGSRSQTSNKEQQSSLKAESSSSSQSETSGSKSGSRVILYPQPQQPIPNPSVQESRKTPCPKEKQQSLPPRPNPSPVTGGIQTSNMEQQSSLNAESSSSSQSETTGSKSGSRVILYPQPQQPFPNPSVQESRKTPSQVTGNIQTSNMEQQSSLKAESSSNSQSEANASKSGSRVILYPQPQQPIPSPSVEESRKTPCPKEKQQSLPSRPNPSPVTGGIQTSNMEQKSSLKAESSSSSQSETAGSKSGSRVVLYPQLEIMKPLPLMPYLSRSKSGVILNPLLQRQSQLLTPNPSPSILKPKHAKTQPIIQIAKLKLQSKPCNPKTQITNPKSQSKPCKQKIDSARAKPLPKLKQCSCGPSIPKSSLPKCKNCCHRRNKRSTDDDEAPPTVEGDNGNDGGESTDAEGRCGRGYGGRRPSFWRIFGR